MKLYVTRDYKLDDDKISCMDSMWLSGHAVVLAPSRAAAYEQIDKWLVESGLKPHTEQPYGLKEIGLSKSQIVYCFDGNY